MYARCKVWPVRNGPIITGSASARARCLFSGRARALLASFPFGPSSKAPAKRVFHVRDLPMAFPHLKKRGVRNGLI